jgi:hypothetical protein
LLVILLILHGLAALALLGAITHQAIAVSSPARPGPDSFGRNLRAVRPGGYANAVAVLYVVTAILGLLIYPSYRTAAHDIIKALKGPYSVGIFDLKEHFVAIGLGVLPAYWHFWNSVEPQRAVRTRRALTLILTAVVWWAFLVGHVINNLRGIGS